MSSLNGTVRMKKDIFVWSLCIVLLNSCSYKRKLTAKKINLSPLFSSGMVIQTSPDTRINGYADPGSILAVRISDYIRIVKADSTGEWETKFPEIILSKRFSIFVEGSDTAIEIKDVLAGKVFVIAGDAFLDPITGSSSDFCTELENLPLQEYKVFRPVPSTIALPGKEFIKGEWVSVNETPFNACTCKAIQAIGKLISDRKSAIGIVDLTWSGSTLEAWLPGISVQDTIPGKTARNDLRQVLRINDSIFTRIRYMSDTCDKGIQKGIKRPWFDDAMWRETTLPVNLSKKMNYQKKRLVYLRKKIYVSEKYLTSDFIIKLGKIHGKADFYFNEVKIEEDILGNGLTQLSIPDSIMREWSNLLTVRLFCTDSLSGFYGSDFLCTNLDSTFQKNIQDKWKYNYSLEADFPQHLEIEKYPSALFNGMLSPVLDHAFSSFVWYGGFNDISDSEGIENGVCNLMGIAKCSNKYIVYDTLSSNDTLVFGQSHRQLIARLKEAETNCISPEVSEIKNAKN